MVPEKQERAMTRHNVYQLLLVSAGGLAVPVGITGLRPVPVVIEPGSTGGPVEPEKSVETPADSLLRIVVDHDVFRMSRTPALLAFNSAPPEAVPTEVPPPKPQLLLTGIVWGTDPGAIVEGLPGIEGSRVLRVGETSGGIRVRRITKQNVTLAGLDTTWVLQVRKPW
jgi:hypothetical protein